MKAQTIAVTLALLLSVAGCGGSSSTIGALPGSSVTGSTSSGRHHLVTKTHVVSVKRSVEKSLRVPKDLIGGVFGLLLDLLDAPFVDGDNAQVNLALVGINVLSNGVATPVVVNSTEVMVNLLSLQTVAQQYAANLPAGSYDTLQLVVDPSNSNVVFDGVTYPVQFGSLPNDPTSYVGIDAPATFTAVDASNVSVTADFNVLESVAIQNSVAQIDPQLVIATNASDVTGSVVNAAGGPVANAVILALDANGNILNSTVTGDDGSFTLEALAAGSATIVVQNSYVSASGETVAATGADAGAAPAPLPLAVPGGNTINIGSLTD
jgi:hypothetical protein